MGIDKQYLLAQNGKLYILYAGLLDLAHRQSAGRLRIATRLVQAPAAENGQTAVCAATAGMYADGGELVRECSGLGDASPANVNRAMATCLIRLAETRAKARALRDLVNVSEALDESDEPAPPPGAAEPVDVLDGMRRKYERLALKAKARGIDARPLAPDADADAITAAGREVQATLAQLDRAAAQGNGAPPA